MTFKFGHSLTLLGLILLAVGPSQIQAGEKAFYRETTIYQATGLLPECYRPSLLKLGNNVLVCAWSAGSGMHALDTSIRMAFKSPDIDTWTAPQVVADEKGYPDNYPVLAELPDGRLRLFYSTLYREKRKHPPGAGLEAWHLKYRDSNDGGRIWGGEFFLIPESGRVPSGRVVELPEGELVLPLTDLGQSNSVFLVSEDRGGYWKDLARIGEPSNLIDPVAATAGNGSLIALLRPLENSQHGKFLWQTESRDDGKTWSLPQELDLQNPCGPVELVNLANGNLVLLYYDHPEWLTFLTVALSEDGGKSWPHKRQLDIGKWDNRDPTLVETSDGHLHLIYVARNIYLKHIEISESWIKDTK